MAFEIKTMQVDLKTGRVRVELTDADAAAHVAIHLQISMAGDQAADGMEQMARAAAKQLLQDAIPVL